MIRNTSNPDRGVGDSDGEKIFGEASKDKLTPEDRRILAVSAENDRRLEQEKVAAEKAYPPEDVMVNGIRMRIYWDDDYRRYTINFPQIEIGKRGDKVIIVSEDPKVARELFRQAKTLAEKESDLYKVFDSIQQLANEIRDRGQD